MKQPHICLDETHGVRYAVLPGDPARLDRVAAQLENVRELAYNREFRSLTGIDVANVNALSPKERATYDENLKIYRDWKATMEYAVEEAETKGKAEGERLATLRNARNMKKAGVDLSLIAECTGLSLEIIQSL